MSHGSMSAHLRIARPVGNLERAAAMYKHGLGLDELGRFENHDGFDGIMLGNSGTGFHLEFTHCRTHPVPPTSTPEDLLVFYIPARVEWEKVCVRMVQAGSSKSGHSILTGTDSGKPIRTKMATELLFKGRRGKNKFGFFQSRKNANNAVRRFDMVSIIGSTGGITCRIASLDSDSCWCDPIIKVDANGEEVVFP